MRKLLLILLFTAVTVISGEKSLNMPAALIPLDADAEKLEALVLARSNDIEFIERDEIDKIKRELKLSSVSLISNDFGIDIRKLKNVRIFALLSSNNIIIFDAHSGIRLVDNNFAGSLEQRVKTVVERLKLATIKAKQAQAGKVLYLAFMPVTPINLSAGELKIARQVERLLQQYMSNRSDMAVLERYHLKLLLDEPNPDTEKLLASSLLIRLAVKKGEKGKLVFSYYTNVPSKSGKNCYSELIIDPGKPLSAQISNFLKIDESTINDDRQNEAKTFAAQARFAANHLLHNNAVALAASASALNKQQELLLADVCSIAAFHAWKYWNKVQLDKMDVFLDNLETAVKIIVKHEADKAYNHHFMQMISKLGYVHQSSFAKMTKKQQQRLRAIMEFYFSAWHRNHSYLLKAPETKKLSVRKKLQYLNNRGEYLRKFSPCLDMAWDYRYFGQYILPVLPGYVKDMNKLVPEIKKFYSIKDEKRRDLYGLDDIQLLNQSLLGSFHNRPLAQYRGNNRKILEATINVLEQAKSIELAQRGARARFAMSGKKSPAKFARETLQRFKTCNNLNLRFPEQNYSMNLDARYIGISTQIRIWETAIKRFGNYRVLLYNILANSRKLSAKQARDLYKLLKKYRKERKTDPRVKLPHGRSHDIIDHPLMLLCQKLEKQFPELAEKSIKLPKRPFNKVIIPCPQYTRDRSIVSSYPAYRNGKIYFIVLNTYNKTFLVSMDPDKNFAAIEHKKLEDKKRLGWYGHIMRPALTDKYLAVQNGPYVMLYPLNGGKAEILDFSNYYNDSPNGIQAVGDRLFLSYGQWAGVKQPGTLLEYNLNSRKTKVLISTLDRNVDWPLKGRKKPFHVYDMAIDSKRKCLLTLFPFPDTRKRYNANRQLCYLYGYFWEENKWRRLSRGLDPLRHQGMSSRIIVEPDGIYFLASSLYKLNKKGELETLLSISAKGYTPNVPTPEASLQRYYYTDYSNGVVCSDNALFFIKSRRMFRFSQTFRTHTVLDGKYVINIKKVLSLGILDKFKTRRDVLK